MPKGISASTPGDQPPHTLVNVVKRDLGEDLGERDSTATFAFPVISAASKAIRKRGSFALAAG